MSGSDQSQKIVVLTVKSQKASGEKIFRLHKKRAVLGSSTSSDVRLDDASISSVHAILEVSGIDGKPVIYDLASDTGLLVNGKPTVQASLNHDDLVTIGPYVIGVRVQSLSESPKSPERTRESFGQTLFVNEKEDLASLLLEDERDVLDIFDHRPESKLSLQVTMFFGNTILDVEHFVDRKRVVIGPGGRDDFSIPPVFGQGKQGRFSLVTNEGGQYLLHLHDNMQGVVSKDGRLMPVKDFMSSMATSSSKAYPLADKDFAKVMLGDVSFFLNFTPAPPRLKQSNIFERDPMFLKIWLGSFALTLALLLAVSSAVVDPTIEIEQLPERVATIIYEPKSLPLPKIPQPKTEQVKVVENKQPPKPKPIQKIVVEPKPITTPPKPNAMIGEKPQDKPQPKPKLATKLPEQKKSAVTGKAGGRAGEGAKALGIEGSRGKVNAPKMAEPQTKAQRPGEGKPTNGMASNAGRSQTNDLGVVDVFKDSKGTLSKILAGGRGAQNAASKLEGYSGFTSQGEGGLGAAGSGAGGGGSSQGIGGLGAKGPGGGRTGTGLGQLGSGGNMLGGKGTLAIDSGGGRTEPIVLGAIDTDAIARAIAAHRDRIKACYEREINAENPDLSGRVGIRFVIGASGTVNTAAVSSTSLKNMNTEQCVVEVIKTIQFPPVRGGGIAEVTYPFVFKPSNK